MSLHSHGEGVFPLEAPSDFIFIPRIDNNEHLWYNWVWKAVEQTASKSRVRGMYDVPRGQWCDAKHLESYTSIFSRVLSD